MVLDPSFTPTIQKQNPTSYIPVPPFVMPPHPEGCEWPRLPGDDFTKVQPEVVRRIMRRHLATGSKLRDAKEGKERRGSVMRESSAEGSPLPVEGPIDVGTPPEYVDNPITAGTPVAMRTPPCGGGGDAGDVELVEDSFEQGDKDDEEEDGEYVPGAEEAYTPDDEYDDEEEDPDSGERIKRERSWDPMLDL
ncbi:hypothetical protein HK097_006666 [Rhizophlyctis rosea]|uniref:Uncharacterized protein n=1 Tax=Rhizophlyctis rosea TaxID=64517 RepID=A0AAD5S0X0_9FUNG|nr:hypothetical protein HK097_006666 [Rhizophlyctis rosea]